MKRQIWKTILCIVLLYCTLGMPGQSTKADSLYVKKIVSVVLDDSGSMSNGNWEYALFSLQNLAAMLNPGDKLFVTRLNRGGTAEYDVTDAGLEASLRKIRTQPNPTGNTDISAVMKAEEHLQKQKSVDDSTEYWLMVLTDGEFTGFQGMQYSNLEDTFRGFLNQTMPNGSRPKVVYLNIAGQHNVQPDEEHGLYAYYANNFQEINDAMAQVSDSVTGRKRFSASNYQTVDDRTVRIKSDIPLANIVILQSGSARIAGVQSDQGQKLEVTRNALADQPLSLLSRLTSMISRIECLSGNIAAGTYTITFNQPFRQEDLTILFEPAVEIRVIGDVAGVSLDQLGTVYIGELLTAGYRIYESGTQDEISLSLLSDAKAGIIVATDKGSKGSSSEVQWTLTNETTQVTAWLDIPGFRRLENTVTLHPEQRPPTPSVDKMNDMTMTIGEYRHVTHTKVVICYLDQMDEKGNVESHTALKTRQELMDDGLDVETRLPFDRSVLYGSDGHLNICFYDDGTVQVGTYPVTVYWGSKVNATFNVIITSSTYTVEANPNPLTLALSEFMSNPQAMRFTLLEDGRWPASCEELGLEVVSQLAGELTFDAGDGVFTFSRDSAPDWGEYHLTPSLKNGTLATTSDIIIHLVRSLPVILVDPPLQSKRQSELSQPAIFTAAMTVDGIAVPFEEGKYTVTQDALKDGLSATLQPDGTLRITATAGMGLPAGQYPITVMAEGATGQGVLEVTASVFAVTPDHDRLSLVTDDLPFNQQSIRFAITADGRPLTEEELGQLSPVLDLGPLPDGLVALENSALRYTPTAPEDWTLLPDGAYPCACILSDGTRGTAEITLTMIKYEVRKSLDGQALSRETLVAYYEALQNPDDRQTLIDDGRAVIFEIYRDGLRMTRQEVESLGFTVSTDERHRNWVEFDARVNDAGQVELLPFRTGSRFKASFAPLGELPITLTVKITPGQASMHILRGGFLEELLPFRIVPILIFLWILGYILKWTLLRNKFHYRTSIYLCDWCVTKGMNIEIEAASWAEHCKLFCVRMLFPWIRDRKRIRGTDIYLESAGGKQVRYLVGPHSGYCHYYEADLGEIQPYEGGKLMLSSLDEIDPEEEDESASNKKRHAHWHSWGVGTAIIRYDGDQYRIYCIKT